MGGTRLLASTCLLTLAAAIPALAAGPDLLSHRAIYKLSLGNSGQARIASVQGLLGLQWRAACEGSVSDQHLLFSGTTDEGEDLAMDVRFNSFEAADDGALRFNVRSFEDGRLSEEFRGLASRGPEGEPGEAQFTIPDDLTIELPTGIVFPTQHVRLLIEAARNGQAIVTYDVFDGSGPDGLSRVTAVIGQVHPVTGAQGRELSWPISLAYFGIDAEDTLPQFEVSYELAENGVLRNVVLDYGEFVLHGELEKLDVLADADCS